MVRQTHGRIVGTSSVRDRARTDETGLERRQELEQVDGRADACFRL